MNCRRFFSGGSAAAERRTPIPVRERTNPGPEVRCGRGSTRRIDPTAEVSARPSAAALPVRMRRVRGGACVGSCARCGGGCGGGCSGGWGGICSGGCCTTRRPPFGVGRCGAAMARVEGVGKDTFGAAASHDAAPAAGCATTRRRVVAVDGAAAVGATMDAELAAARTSSWAPRLKSSAAEASARKNLWCPCRSPGMAGEESCEGVLVDRTGQ